ncbi:hypothetical protein PG991_000946 [Apiospora marii]|uniref:Uncharacterized protein n=2 Tax=Apiospora marii TaxID=335849 RepID=A0ABR1STF2_9PEZI
MDPFQDWLRQHSGFPVSKLDFFSLPRELRDQIYEQCLVCHTRALHPWIPERFRVPRHETTVGLFGASKAVRREAAEVFYSQNLIEFALMKPAEIAGFLQRIGRNAHHIRRVVVSFPLVRPLPWEPLGHFTIVPHDAAVLDIIRQGCPNLHTIRTGRRGTGSMIHFWTLSDLWYWKGQPVPDHGKAVKNLLSEAFGVLDAHFRSNLPSLQHIVLELDEETEFGPPLTLYVMGAGERKEDHIRYQVLEAIKGHKWALDSTEKGCEEYSEGIMMDIRRRVARTLMLCESTSEELEDEYFLSMF